MDDAVHALIAIPTLNEESHLSELLDQLCRTTIGLSVKMFVVDGGSTDSTIEIAANHTLKDARVRLLNNPKRIQSAAINLAAAQASQDTEFLIRIDAHSRYPDDYCATLIEEAKTTGADSVVVSMNAVGKHAVQRAIAAAQNSIIGNGGSAHRNSELSGRWVDHGHHALMRLEAFNAAGHYDETFSHNEDAELDVRLGLTEHKIWLTNRTAIEYFPRSSFISLAKQYYKYGFGRAGTLLKHHTLPKVRQIIPAFFIPMVLAALLGKWMPFLMFPALFWFAASLFYGAWLACAAKDVALLLSGVAAVTMHAAWSAGVWVRLVTRSESHKNGRKYAP